ncbi:MAG: hypothetical protein LBN09_05700 [Clostridioides sp.]|jgi:hypothetical protein|nr:hypothetical protein [Clostridioides sp.]
MLKHLINLSGSILGIFATAFITEIAIRLVALLFDKVKTTLIGRKSGDDK